MEIYPTIVVEVPLLVPLGAAYGIGPIRLGIIFLANMEGLAHAACGAQSSDVFLQVPKTGGEVLRAVLPVVVVMSVGVLLITCLHVLTTFLPKLFGR
jgi:C4-dicarboxylate transporter, DctM subunit